MEWLTGFGSAAALFFLAKGVLWLIVPGAIVLMRQRARTHKDSPPTT